MSTCWCDSAKPAAECCEPFLTGIAYPNTAEQLMRARYSAFVTHNEPFLRRSWHPACCPASLSFNTEQRWLGLKIISTVDGTEQDGQGTVSFVARYKIRGKGYRLEETSRFTRHAGDWVYLDGVVNSSNT